MTPYEVLSQSGGFYLAVMLVAFLIGMIYWKVKQRWGDGDTQFGTGMAALCWPFTLLILTGWGLLNFVTWASSGTTDYIAGEIRKRIK